MSKNFYELYDILYSCIEQESVLTECGRGELWGYAQSADGFGVAMNTPGNSIKPVHGTLEGIQVKEAAYCARSWNLDEATIGLAAANSCYNTIQRMKALNCSADIKEYGTEGLDIEGKTVGIIGHMNGTPEIWTRAKQVYRTERNPQEGDYPDSACDLLLPQCDIVLITGSSIINKTLPHLLELCENAFTILTGPSVPMCPELLDIGIDRLCGTVFTDPEGMKNSIRSGAHGSPFKYGVPFILKKR